ncbi:MAG: hypothetical protein ACPKPY_03200 [Nitrososphaeraceae archaeon]
MSIKADYVHLVQSFFSNNTGKFNALKIVHLITFPDVIEQCKKISTLIIFNFLLKYHFTI